MKRILIAVLALTALLPATSLGAASHSYKSKVTIEFVPGKRVDAFGGEVKSSHDACIADRKVILYGQKKSQSKPVKVGSDVSRDDGFWGVEHTPEARFYFAKVKPADVPGGTCESAVSKTVEFLD